MPGANRNGVTFRFEMDEQSVSRLNRALRAVGEVDAPFLREALLESADDLASEMRRRAPGSIGARIELRGIKGTGANIRATGTDLHPGARSMEFGRVWYYTGFEGNNRPGSKRRKGSIRSGGRKVRRQGQQARPFMGVVSGGHAVGAVQPRVRERIMNAIEKEWERIGNGGS